MCISCSYNGGRCAELLRGLRCDQSSQEWRLILVQPFLYLVVVLVHSCLPPRQLYAVFLHTFPMDFYTYRGRRVTAVLIRTSRASTRLACRDVGIGTAAHHSLYGVPTSRLWSPNLEKQPWCMNQRCAQICCSFCCSPGTCVLCREAHRCVAVVGRHHTCSARFCLRDCEILNDHREASSKRLLVVMVIHIYATLPQ